MKCSNCNHFLSSCKCYEPTIDLDEESDMLVLHLSPDCQAWNWASMLEGWGAREEAYAFEKKRVA